MAEPQQVPEADSVAALVARVAARDPVAEEELYARYRRGVSIILNQATAGRAIAADLAQETFHVVFQKIRRGEIREPAKIASFIWSTAHFLAIEYFRKQHRNSSVAIEGALDIPDNAPGPLDQVLESEKGTIVREILNRLASKRHREMLYRFYVKEEDKEVICADLGLNSLQFNLVLYRARKQYRRLYEELVESDGRQ